MFIDYYLSDRFDCNICVGLVNLAPFFLFVTIILRQKSLDPNRKRFLDIFKGDFPRSPHLSLNNIAKKLGALIQIFTQNKRQISSLT